MASNRTPFLLSLLMLTVVFSPLAGATNHEDPLSATILTEWVDDGTGNISHGYLIVLSESVDFGVLANLSVEIDHLDSEGVLRQNWTLDWTGGNDTQLSIVLNSTLVWKDEVAITVLDDITIIGSRIIQVTIWNEPMADHEITRVTNWNMVHSAINFTASESWDLVFSGQGWQKRTGDLLESNELGSGTLSIQESTEGGTGTIAILLWLDTVWLNETVDGNTLQNQIFEMRGNGTIDIENSGDGVTTEISGNVVNSYIIRSLDQGVVEEWLRLEANGDIHLSSSGGGESMEANGTLALLLVETHDIDGQRVLSNTEFEGTAGMEISGEDYQMDLDLEQLIFKDRWDNGVFTSSLSRIQGDGAFDFTDNEENSSMTVNATVYEFFSESVDGLKTGDRLHVDGTFSGDVNGDFGIVRDIIASGHSQANATGMPFDTNVIFTESWVNLTSVGNNPFDVEAVHNKTWDYEVPEDHWENRTVRLRWDSTEGGEPSEGDEFPERSPIQIAKEAPEAGEGLGNAEITRETGLAPATLVVGDRLDLLDSELMHLSVIATSTGTVNRDGHIIPVTHWSGTYASIGTATGAVVNEGVLAGLIAEVTRNVTIDLDDGESIEFSETQSLARVLSPSIITASENTAPSIISVSIREGALTNENGMMAHLEVEVDDPDWNIRGVTVDFTGLGLGIVTLNDVGVDGDTAIHDDVFTAEILYPGAVDGDFSFDVSVFDDYATTDESHDIDILNRLPRITEVSFAPNTLSRGDNTTVSIRALDTSGVTSVGIDTTQWGGEMTWLSENGGLWIGEFEVPAATPSGDQVLPVYATDGAGGMGTTTMLTITTGGAFATGAYTLEEMPPLHILNEGPEISNVTFLDGETVITSLAIPISETNQFTLTARVTDIDTVTIVQAKLGLIAPAGQSESWISMRDDGLGPDAVAGDGIYSVGVEVRPGMPGGPTTFDIRGIDVQLAQTPTEDRTFVIELGTPPSNGGGGGEAVLSGASAPWVILAVIGLLLLFAGVGVVIYIRKVGLDELMGVEDETLPPG